MYSDLQFLALLNFVFIPFQHIDNIHKSLNCILKNSISIVCSFLRTLNFIIVSFQNTKNIQKVVKYILKI
jgi:hypothetical protein